MQWSKTFPAMLCSPDPYASITTNAAIFGSLMQAEDVMLGSEPPGEATWAPDARQDVIDWLDLENEACRWSCGTSFGFSC